MAVAAGCVREGVDVCLCMVVTGQEGIPAHAFLTIPSDHDQPVYDCVSIDEFMGKMVEGRSYKMVDPTPGERTACSILLDNRSPEHQGMVYVVFVQKAVRGQKTFYGLPSGLGRLASPPFSLTSRLTSASSAAVRTKSSNLTTPPAPWSSWETSVSAKHACLAASASGRVWSGMVS